MRAPKHPGIPCNTPLARAHRTINTFGNYIDSPRGGRGDEGQGKHTVLFLFVPGKVTFMRWMHMTVTTCTGIPGIMREQPSQRHCRGRGHLERKAGSGGKW